MTFGKVRAQSLRSLCFLVGKMVIMTLIYADVSKTKDVSGWKKALDIRQLLCP